MTTQAPDNVVPPVQPTATTAAPASPGGSAENQLDARAQALDAIKAKLTEGVDAADTVEKIMESISNSIVMHDKNINSSKDILDVYIKSPVFAMESDVGIKNLVSNTHKHFSGPSKDAEISVSDEIQNKLIDEANKKKAAIKDPASGLDSQKAPYTDVKTQNSHQEITAAAVAMGYLGKAISSAFGSKKAESGPSFQALQAGGEGLGMNNPNQDPSNLMNISIERMAQRAQSLSDLKADADPAVIAKAKSEFLDAAGDAQRHIGNEHRSMLSQMAEGKKHEFDASDTIKERGEKFDKAMKQAESSEAAADDPDFKAKAKESSDKLAEQIKQLMDSIKEMAKKLMSMGNDNDNKAGPSAPAPGR